MAILKECTTEIQIRFADLDAYAHVNNAVYMSYLEVARLPLVREIFLEDMKKNIQYVLVKAEVNYMQPITFDDKLLVYCCFSEMTGAKFTISYHLHNGEGKTFSKAQTVHALFNANTGKPMRIPEEWKKIMQ